MPLTRRSYYLGSFAWASLPVASATPGYWARVSDVGVQLRVVSDGARWVPDGIQILARSAVAASCPADVTEDTLATIVVPAGILGVSGGLRIDATWTITNSANNKTMRHTFAGTAFSAITLTASGGLRQLSTLQNRNATNAQVGGIPPAPRAASAPATRQSPPRSTRRRTRT